ncbi:DUF4388 domain-containing protein [Oscillatoria sp. FACHB-1406]|uniref:DUF4388 domain-containing protein n=1 Tax=Oscillatoria sp. FACHB-1406 TaxID=2692846 RepID=UPI001688C1DF|nr:DUF4388 domain-containing protein [Oscillatoria sp. FACHB-1406]MBD2576457.1 DUF4388 domain-containing protein [Oscillatoria sp. FACHB-1406]
MGISGRLITFSLAEVLQILARGRKTGLLTIQGLADEQWHPAHYIWFYNGRIVGAASSLDCQGLLLMMHQRKWLSPQALSELNQLRELDTPLGSYLKIKSHLQGEQLKLLFHVQVLQRVCTLFKYKDGRFKFDSQAPLPKAEMTGMSISGVEGILLGLRVLRDWSALTDKLPSPKIGLIKPLGAKLTLSLDSLERKVWDLADGMFSLEEIAVRTALPITAIQQTAFRLISVGLVEEVAIEAYLPTLEIVAPLPEEPSDTPKQEEISPSFLKNLVGFLKSKVSYPGVSSSVRQNLLNIQRS